MTHDNPYIPRPAIPVDETFKEVERERVLKEKLKDARLKKLNAGDTEIVLPDEDSK